MTSRPTVLFLCPHNAAKSLLAVAAFDHMAAARGLPFRADSAGTEPAGEPSPAVVAALRDDGVDVAEHRPRFVTARDVAGAHRIISMGCAAEDLPGIPGRLDHWNDVPPVSEDLSVARETIRRHVAALVDDLAKDQSSDPRAP